MKHTPKILLLIIAIAFIAACSKSGSNKQNDTPVGIIGKWYEITDTAHYYLNGQLQQLAVITPSPKKYYFRFETNGTGAEYSDSTANDSLHFNYTFNGKAIYFNYPSQPYDGGTSPFIADTVVINKLTANMLVFSYNNKFTLPTGTSVAIETVYYSK